MKELTRSLRESLWNGFTSDGMYTSEKELSWAVNDAIQRTDIYGLRWRTVTARKIHECEAGHIIHEGDQYVSYAYNDAWGQDLKFCMKCSAMLFYFMKTYEFPIAIFSHWDTVKNEPKHDK